MTVENAKFVNSRFLFWVLTPLFRHMDVEAGEYPDLEFPGLDSNNSDEVKRKVIRPFIVPLVHNYDEKSQGFVKDSFRYYLNVEPAPTEWGTDLFQSVLNSLTLSFENPRPPRLFFVWIWEELYSPEDYQTDDLSHFVVDNDTPYRITTPVVEPASCENLW